MAFVGELEIVDELAHLPHLLDHRPRLGDGAPRIVGPAGEEDRGPDFPTAQVAVAQTAPGASMAGAAAVVRREDREALRGHELKPRVPIVDRLRLRTPVRIHQRGVAAALFSGHEEPRRNRSAVETRIPNELSDGEFVLGKGLSEAVDEGYRPLAPPEDEAGGLRELTKLGEKTPCVPGADGPARPTPPTGHPPGGPSLSGDGLQLDVSIAVLQERDPLSVRGPEGHRLVPPALDDEPDFLRLDIEHADVHMVVDV